MVNKTTVSQYLTESASSSWLLSRWPEKLMTQHNQLDVEINAINALLGQDVCRLLQLDARLKKLIKGVITHLELEACFLTPMLVTSDVSPEEKDSLSKGFKALYRACHDTTDYVQALKLELGNGLVKPEHIIRITNLLADINNRLNDENAIYSTMNKVKESV